MAAQKRSSGSQRVTEKRLRWILLILSGLFLSSLVWFVYSTDPKITGLRNTIHYRVVKALGGPQARAGELPGSIEGTICDTDSEPLAGALVLVASPASASHTAKTDLEGRYRIDGVPPGRYVPVAGKRGYKDTINQTCLAALCYKRAVTVRPASHSHGVDLTLTPSDPPELLLDDSLMVSSTMEIEVGPPFPSKVLRTRFSFERTGLWINDCCLYEPLEGQEPLPTLLLVLPGPVHNWEIIPVPFAAEGFSVAACYPLRGIDIDGDAADLLTALDYVRQGRIPSRADPERLGLVGARFTSLHVYRTLRQTDQFDASLVLGGMADGFAFRRAAEEGTVHTRPPFDQVLVALGFPNTSPELYFRYSIIFHLEGMPPVCLLHGTDDELSPFSQSVQLAEELERREMPHQFYAYESLSHYFSTSADNATTQRMFQDSLGCLHRWLESE